MPVWVIKSFRLSCCGCVEFVQICIVETFVITMSLCAFVLSAFVYKFVLHLCTCRCELVSLLHFNGYFPGEPGLAGFIGTKDDGSCDDNLSPTLSIWPHLFRGAGYEKRRESS